VVAYRKLQCSQTGERVYWEAQVCTLTLLTWISPNLKLSVQK